MRCAFMLALLALLALAACAQVGSNPTPSPAPSSSVALAPPILTEPQAIETASQKAALNRRGLAGVSNIRNQQARLMTMGEYWDLGQYDKGFFGSAKWYPESDLPVWVVLMEGSSKSTLPTSSPPTTTRYNHFVVVLNAHTGYEIGFSPLSDPDQLLGEAQGLDPSLYGRYPLEADLEYTKAFTDFPVAEPSSLPGGFSLVEVTLELAHPLQDVLPNPQEPRQTVLQNYSDGQGTTIQLAQFRGGLPDLIENADLAAVQETKAWASQEAGQSPWLAWTWVFPEAGAYVTYILRSGNRSISLDTLHEIAASMPGGRPPLPPPEPVRVPTALPSPRTTTTGCSEREEEPPCGPGVEIGKPYPYTLYTHCGIRSAYFDGRRWVADPILKAGVGGLNPSSGWGDPFERGGMGLVAEDVARFSSSAGLVADFRPLPEGSEYPWGPCL